jgi:LacI family transcriptional regulator
MKSITIKDVAQLSGVSISTVSRVINGYSNVNDETKEVVEKAIEELAFRPNSLAKGLRSQKTKTLGLVVNNILNPIYSVMAQGIESTARKHGFQLFLCNSGADPDQEAEYLEALWNKRIDGLLISPTGSNKTLLNKYLKENIPVIQVDRKMDGLMADSVLTDNVQGASQVVKHLLDKGYRKIAIIVGMQTVTTGMDRMKGYFNALAEFGLSPESSYIKIGDFTEETGFKLMKELLSLPNSPDSVFVGNNLMARGAMLAIREAKLKIPNNLAFVMFDNPDWTQLHDPPLTVVEQPTYQLGVQAAELLFKRLNDPRRINEPEVIMLENKLIIREST